MSHQTQAELDHLLDLWSEAPDDAARELVTQRIRDTFGQRLAVLVLDMSGFSETVIRHGIVHFLSRIRLMRSTVVPIVNDLGGTVVKYIADDVLAVFSEPDRAFEAARRIVHAAAHAGCDAEPLAVSIGVGYGQGLHVPGTDLWGDEANRAFKLGEDIGSAGEVLLTRAAYDALNEESRTHECERTVFNISGVELEAYVWTG